VQPLGERYWWEIYPESVRLEGSETAYLAIGDPWLVTRLLRMDFQDGFEAARTVDEVLGLAATGFSRLTSSVRDP
jgi:hypothetical protein